MTEKQPIRSKEDLLAHAIAIEREAATRYRELGERMGDLGNDAVAELFLHLAGMEKTHQLELERRAAGMALPPIGAGEYAWFDDGAPETAAHDLVLKLLTPHSALMIALAAEERAAEFFETIGRQSRDPALAGLAAEMATEESVHAAWVQSALRRTPDSVIDWNAVFG